MVHIYESITERKKIKKNFLFRCIKSIGHHFSCNIPCFSWLWFVDFRSIPDFQLELDFNWCRANIFPLRRWHIFNAVRRIVFRQSLGYQILFRKKNSKNHRSFCIWGFVLSVFLVIISFYYPKMIHTINPYTINNFLGYLWNSYMAKNFCFSPYWFFWMILGTYLIMPIFNKWLYNSDLKEAEYFLVIWAVTCLFTETLGMTFPIKLNYFAGPIGMVVLGYYLRHTKRKIFNNIYVSIFLVIFCLVAFVLLSHANSSPDTMAKFSRYHILMVIEVIGLFTLFKNISNLDLNSKFFSNDNGIFRKSIYSIAKYSYGIYLIHRVIQFYCLKSLHHWIYSIILYISQWL